MIRFVVHLAALFALICPLAARADVVSGDAVPGFGGFTDRHGTEMSTVGPLAPSLQGKPVVVRIHADW